MYVLPDHRLAPLMLFVDRATLFVFHQIADLSLHLNQLTGVIPAELDQLSNLEQFSLRGDRLTGSRKVKIFGRAADP